MTLHFFHDFALQIFFYDFALEGNQTRIEKTFYRPKRLFHEHTEVFNHARQWGEVYGEVANGPQFVARPGPSPNPARARQLFLKPDLSTKANFTEW